MTGADRRARTACHTLDSATHSRAAALATLTSDWGDGWEGVPWPWRAESEEWEAGWGIAFGFFGESSLCVII